MRIYYKIFIIGDSQARQALKPICKLITFNIHNRKITTISIIIYERK